MGTKLTAGIVTLDGQQYSVLVDQTNTFSYQRSTEPKAQATNGAGVIASSPNNQIEATWASFVDGYGDVQVREDRQSLHYAMNLFMEHSEELVILPAPSSIESSLVIHTESPPTVIWEQSQPDGTTISYVFQDRRAFRISGVPSLIEDLVFPSTVDMTMTDGVVFDNIFYAAMGGLSTDPYIRKRVVNGNGTATWSADAQDWKSIATSTGDTPIEITTSAAHGLTTGNKIFIKDHTQAAANGLWTITVVNSTKFTLNSSVGTGAGTGGQYNLTDSDVRAEHLAIVGDLMVRTYKDATLGWVTSRVDPIDSDPLVDANWTAGIGTVTVGDKTLAITAMVPVGDGEVICKPEGVFIYHDDDGAYINEVPELEEHVHPDNGKGAFEWKGWVYIPTVIGLLRYRNGQVQDVTPGRTATQSFETPIGPIVSLTGDVNRLYAAIKPFSIHMPKKNSSGNTIYFVVSVSGGTPTNYTADVTDGDTATAAVLSSMTTAGYFSVGAKNQWHRAYLEITDGNEAADAKLLDVEYWNGAWVDFTTPVQDFTLARQKAGQNPRTLRKSGNIVLPYIPADWVFAQPSGFPNAAYWVRFKPDRTLSATVKVKELAVGPHVAGVGVNRLDDVSKEIAVDHGGVVLVLSAQEEQGRGLVWRTMWAFGRRRDATNDGGAQPVGAIGIVQPAVLQDASTAQRWLYVGMEKVSYLCPLGNKPDPTLIVPTERDGITNEIVAVLPDHACGMPNTPKTLIEADINLENTANISSIEVYYRVDRGAWTRIGTWPTNPFPMRLPAGTEPTGKTFGLLLSVTENNTTGTKYLTMRNPRIKVMPRPRVVKSIQMTLDLMAEQRMPGVTKRADSRSSYSALEALVESNVTVQFKDIDDTTRWVQVQQVRQRMMWTADTQPPRMVVDVTLIEP